MLRVDAVSRCEDTVVATGAVRQVCDLYSAHYLGWVDNQGRNLEVDVVERAVSAFGVDGRLPVIFARGGIRSAAWQRAETSGVGLLWFDPQNASLDGGNSIGRKLCASGMVSG